ncbi:response regulator [Lentilitoribacter sp. Alg239-R112]|uniref:sigma-54-dependent transcriptional regulator n=1 Tax=Lentilitoribacter sp. Alg239-R112 TaxID=2305987 RepID=UPI0013A6F44C|nr:response regulator [Lentilitoribacter sp. Alg239-R112]
MTNQILLIEDDDALRFSLAQAFDLEGFKVIQSSNFDQARRTIRANFNGVILSDIRMPGKDGFDVLQYSQGADPDLPVVLLTGEADVPMALRAMRQGAYDFIEKPCKVDYLIEVMKRALEQRQLVLRNRKIERDLARNDLAAVNFPGNSAATKDLRKAIRAAANTNSNIHLSGPEGIGRRVAAHTIHKLSDQQCQFISLSISNNEWHKLENVGQTEYQLDVLIKNLERATSEDRSRIVVLLQRDRNFRIITSSIKSLSEHRETSTDQELYDLLAPIEIRIPTFAQRREDIPEIFETLVRQVVRTRNEDMPEITEGIITEVMTGKWQKNLVDLRELASKFVSEASKSERSEFPSTLAQRMDTFERLNLIEALKRHKGQAATAAEELGLPRKTFYDRLKRYSLLPKDYT